MADLLTRPLVWIVVVAAIAVLAAALALARPRPASAALTDVSVQELHAAALEGALVLDVREPFEYAGGRVAGSVLVPLGTITSRLDDFDRGAPVYVVCRSGNRSLAAAQELVAAGYTDVRNVRGGMIAWSAAGLPVER